MPPQRNATVQKPSTSMMKSSRDNVSSKGERSSVGTRQKLTVNDALAFLKKVKDAFLKKVKQAFLNGVLEILRMCKNWKKTKFITDVSQANTIVKKRWWVVDSGATRHLCASKYAFASYTTFVRDYEKFVFLADSHPAAVLGKGIVFLKLPSGKILALDDVLHVPSITHNLISVSMLGKKGIKVSFEFDKVLVTKNDVFIGHGYCHRGIFVLGISQVQN